MAEPHPSRNHQDHHGSVGKGVISTTTHPWLLYFNTPSQMQHECSVIALGELTLLYLNTPSQRCHQSVQLLNNVDIYHVTNIGDYIGWLYWGHIGSIHRVHEKLREGNPRLQDYTNTLNYYTLTRTTPLPTCITNFEIYNGHQSTWVNQFKRKLTVSNSNTNRPKQCMDHWLSKSLGTHQLFWLTF